VQLLVRCWWWVHWWLRNGLLGSGVKDGPLFDSGGISHYGLEEDRGCKGIVMGRGLGNELNYLRY
jgi:hypothetical protein